MTLIDHNDVATYVGLDFQPTRFPDSGRVGGVWYIDVQLAVQDQTRGFRRIENGGVVTLFEFPGEQFVDLWTEGKFTDAHLFLRTRDGAGFRIVGD